MKPRKFFKRARERIAERIKAGIKSATFLIECGAGKSTIPPAASYDLRRMGIIDALVWLVPRWTLITQAEAAMNYADPKKTFIWRDLLCVPDAEAARYRINGLMAGNPKAGIDPAAGDFGYCCSFNALTSDLAIHLQFLEHHRALVVADEIQLCEEGATFGNAIHLVKERAAFFVAMSGDLDRPSRTEVAGLEYEVFADGKGLGCRRAKTDLDYNIYEALSDNAIIPLDFCYGQGPVGFTRDGKPWEYPSIEQVPSEFASYAVEAVVSSEYADHLLKRCLASWRGHRTTGIVAAGDSRRGDTRKVTIQPNAQLLVVCCGQDHARAVHRKLIEQHGISSARCALAVSDDDSATDELDAFKDGQRDVAVTVAMGYIGMDAPRISHLCCLTNYRSASWLHQMLARAWRLSPDLPEDAYREQYAVCFTPNDKRFQAAIEKIRRAMQIGAIDHDDGDGPQADGEGATNHWASLDYTENRYEITVENPWIEIPAEGDATSESISPPDEQATREALRNLGWDSYRVEAAIAALTAQEAEDPVTDSRTPRKRRHDLANELNAYQCATTRMWTKVRHPLKKAYAKVNYELERMTGWERSVVKADEAKLRECLDVYAPRLRRQLLNGEV